MLVNRLMDGRTLLGKVLFDMSVGIDILTSLEEVNAEQVGFIGHSYGGRLAMFAPVFDKRIRVAVSSCGSTSFGQMVADESGIQFDFVVPGLLKYGDLADVVRLVDPASLLILGCENDRWSQEIDSLVQLAATAFTEGVLEAAVFPGKHQFSLAMREQAYGFFDTFLKK